MRETKNLKTQLFVSSLALQWKDLCHSGAPLSSVQFFVTKWMCFFRRPLLPCWSAPACCYCISWLWLLSGSEDDAEWENKKNHVGRSLEIYMSMNQFLWIISTLWLILVILTRVIKNLVHILDCFLCRYFINHLQNVIGFYGCSISLLVLGGTQCHK